MQHRTLFRGILLIFVIHVVALGINMVSDDAEQWLSDRLGPHYLLIVSVVLLISLVLLFVLEQPTKRAEPLTENTATQPQRAAPLPSGRETIIPSPVASQKKSSAPTPPTPEAYRAIEASIAIDHLEPACDLMRPIPVFRTTALGFQGRLAELQNRVRQGTLTADQRTASRNEIREQMISVLAEWTPTALLVTETSTTDKATSEGLYRTITNPEDGWLRAASGELLGRAAPLAQLSEWLTSPQPASVLVHALAGTGKTELCRAALADYLRADNNGRIVHYIEVEYIANSEALLNTLGELSGVPESDRRLPRILTALEEMPTALFYLDNLETALDDPKTITLLQRLQRLDGHRWLASSRRLEANWQHTLDLDVLEPDVALALFRRTWLRHQANWPEPTPVELITFLEKTLGHHPLSIVLTASHAPEFSDPTEVINSWRRESDRLLVHFTGGRVDHRLQNWPSSLALSLDRLRQYPDACRLWCLTMLFQEGIEGKVLQLVEALGIAGPGDRAELIRRNLARLRNGRLEVLPPVAEFIRLVLRTGGDSSLSEPQLFEDSLRLALQLEEPGLVDYRLDVMDYFTDKVDRYPRLSELDRVLYNLPYLSRPFRSREILSRLRHQPHYERDQGLLAQSFYNLAQLAFLLGDNDPARDHYARAAQLYRKTGSELGLANVESNLGELAFRLGDNDPARDHYARAAQLYRKTGDEQGLANVESNLGQLAFRLGDNDPARDHYARAAQLYRKTGDEQGLANVESNLGQLAFLLGDNDPARDHYARATQLYRKTGSEQGLANVERNLGQLAFRLGDNDPARDHYARAAQLYRKTGDEQGLANVESNLGELAFRLGDNDPARDHYARAAQLYRKTGYELGLGHVSHFIAEIAWKEKQFSTAYESWDRALGCYRRVQSPRDIAETLLYLVDTARQGELVNMRDRVAGQLEEAKTLIEQYDLSHLSEKLARLSGDVE